MTSPDEGRLIQANGISVYDWGAAVAWLTAVARPDRVRTLTAISPGDHYLDGQAEGATGTVPALDQAVGAEQRPVAGLELDVQPGRARVQAGRRREPVGGHDLQARGPGRQLDRRMVPAVDSAGQGEASGED